MGSPIQFELRAALPEDAPGILAIAAHLDSVNLPHDLAAIEDIIAYSVASFRGDIPDATHRRYVFVLHDLAQGRVVGTSMVVAQLGHKDAPYVYLQVRPEERYSHTLDRHFEHLVLRMAYSYAGPTEIGGLVMDPAYRGHPGRLGKQISFVRFLLMAARPALFQEEVLAELMPPLLPDGTSHLWEAVGRRFTGLDYRTADRLSRENKEFIRSLFPDGDIYATLLSDGARQVIGAVGESTRGVAAMLQGIGFRYADRVDPFDGGPHYLAPLREIHPIREARERAIVVGEPTSDAAPHILGRFYDGPPFFRGVCTPHVTFEADAIRLPQAVAAQLELSRTDRAWVLPIQRRPS